MPLLLAPLVGLFVGAGLAWRGLNRSRRASRRRQRDDGGDAGALVTTRAFLVTLAFAGFVFAPVTAYFVAFHADWSYLYFVPARRIPSAVDLALVLLATGTVPLGFVLAASSSRASRTGAVAAIAAVPACLALGLGFLWKRRLLTSGTYAQFHGDFGTEAVVSSSLGAGIVWMGLVLVLGLVWSLRHLQE